MQEPTPAVLEWGDDRASRASDLARRASDLLRQHRLPAPLARRAAPIVAGLAGLAAFGSLVGGWQDVTYRGMPAQYSGPVGVAAVGVWGTMWLAGAIVLGTCGLLTFLGHRPVRPYARSIGLALTGALFAMLAAAAVNLGDTTVLDGRVLFRTELRVGWGLWAAHAAVLLLAAALHLARTPAGAAADGPSVERGAARAGGRAAAAGRARHRAAEPDPAVPAAAEPVAGEAVAGEAVAGEPVATGPVARPDVTVAPAEPFRYLSGRDELR